MSLKKKALAAVATVAIGAGTLFSTLPTAENHEAVRSSRWPAVRAKFLETHGECAACGGKENLNVHHIVSFHVDPSLELNESNLVTLCTKSRCGMNDHFIFGHNLNWKCRNPEVVEDARRFREMLDGRLCDEKPR